jgi:hypothetical protein
VQNTAIGSGSLFSNKRGNQNTATGYQALFSNANTDSNIFPESDDNTANGALALRENTTGAFNTAIGAGALQFNTTGDGNTAAGIDALFRITGNSNIALGENAGANLITGDNNIDIGNTGVAAESNTIRIGTQGTQTKTFIAGINGAGVTGVAVKVNAAGQLGTVPSSARFKDEIKPMDKASQAILALKPVTFRYKKELDPDRAPQFGLVAEDVEKVNPDLVARDGQGKVYTVRYEAVNAMLLNEFLKEHRTVQEQEATIAQLKKEMETVVAHLKKQDSKIQKVSDRLEVNKPAPQMAVNDR